ncbi:E3 ubiquitin-protein ligase PPP1R11-like [Lutzomyia longipalpis]|uniref:E3 ubiquitin-protein ligase PPP1R11-like n=1 Tax=Lutzomyia longipalpis TaxID=7200 RepID=UPI0024834FE1|nr:E3 ubiquitin-protein ligase PPP1R11-like [Lutzomyia longipalpis]
MATSPSSSMESAATITTTEVIARPANGIEEAPVLRLRLHKPKSDKKVSWNSDTVDNEGMGKKKSKCCCVYHKPLNFGESSSEDEDECEHCFGHVEMRKKKRIPPDGDADDDGSKPPEGFDEADGAGPSRDSGGGSRGPPGESSSRG